MKDEKTDGMPNPFSVFTESRSELRQRRSAAIQKLAAALLLIGIFVAVQAFRTGKFGTRDLFGIAGNPSVTEETLGEGRLGKLAHIEQLDPGRDQGFDFLVDVLVDETPEVRDAAARRIEREWARWLTLSKTEREQRQNRCTALLSGIVGGKRTPEFRRLVERLAEIASWTGVDPDSSAARSFPQLTHGSSESETAIGSRPILLQMPEDLSAEWTEWPPTRTAPRLYRPERRLHRLSKIDSPPILAQQTSKSASETPGASTSARTADEVQFWIERLQSRSRRERIAAITALERIQDPRAVGPLSERLAVETDQTVAYKLQESLHTTFAGKRGVGSGGPTGNADFDGSVDD